MSEVSLGGGLGTAHGHTSFPSPQLPAEHCQGWKHGPVEVRKIRAVVVHLW